MLKHTISVFTLYLHILCLFGVHWNFLWYASCYVIEEGVSNTYAAMLCFWFFLFVITSQYISISIRHYPLWGLLYQLNNNSHVKTFFQRLDPLYDSIRLTFCIGSGKTTNQTNEHLDFWIFELVEMRNRHWFYANRFSWINQ